MLFPLASLILKGIDLVNAKKEPWKPFTRTPEIIDSRSLEEKAGILHDQHQREFVQGGLSWIEKPNSLGDMCLWQGVYTAYMSMRGGEEFRAARGGLWLHYLLFPECVVVRGVAPTGSFLVDPSKVYKEKNGYSARDNASLDSFVGFVYGLAHFPEEDRRIWADAVAKQLEGAGWQLRNFDGSPTTYGDLRPKLLQAPVRLLALLALLKMAPSYQDMYKKLLKERGNFLSYGETHFLWKEAWFNGHMAMLCYDMLLKLEKDEALAKPYREGLQRIWDKKKETGNAWLTYVCAAHKIRGAKEYIGKADQVMAEYAIPQTKDGVLKKNSDRTDIEVVKWGGERVATQPLPSWRMPAVDYLWQRKPYTLDGEEHLSYSGLDYLVAYEVRKAYFR